MSLLENAQAIAASAVIAAPNLFGTPVLPESTPAQPIIYELTQQADYDTQHMMATVVNLDTPTADLFHLSPVTYTDVYVDTLQIQANNPELTADSVAESSGPISTYTEHMQALQENGFHIPDNIPPGPILASGFNCCNANDFSQFPYATGVENYNLEGQDTVNQNGVVFQKHIASVEPGETKENLQHFAGTVGQNTMYKIFNEPNNQVPGTGSTPMSVEQFSQEYVQRSQWIHEVAPNAVAAPGSFLIRDSYTDSEGNNPMHSDLDYLRQFLGNMKNENVELPTVLLDIYTYADPNVFEQKLKAAREVMNEMGFQNTPISIAEVGVWPWYRADGSPAYSQSQMGNFMQQIFHIVSTHPEYGVAQFAWFSMRDPRVGSNSFWESNLLNPDGTRTSLGNLYNTLTQEYFQGHQYTFKNIVPTLPPTNTPMPTPTHEPTPTPAPTQIPTTGGDGGWQKVTPDKIGAPPPQNEE